MGKLPKTIRCPAARHNGSVGDNLQWRAGLQRAMLVNHRFHHEQSSEDADDQGGNATLPAELEKRQSTVSWEAPAVETDAEGESIIKSKVRSRLSLVALAAEEKYDWIAPAQSQDGLPSVKDALERYYQPPPVMPVDDELARMKRCFLRFKPKVMPEVSVEYFPMILDLLGYYTFDRPDEHLLRYDTFSFEDFSDALNERYVPAERKLLEEHIAEWNALGKTREKALVEIMHNLGAPCTTSSVEATLSCGLLYNPKLNSAHDHHKEVLRFLAARRSCEGFSAEEREQLHEAFDECNVDDSGFIAASELSNALLTFAGLNCVEILKEMMKGVDFDGAPRVSFDEFVSFARILQTRQMRDMVKHMQAEDKDGDGLLSVRELRATMIRAGYRLTNLEFKERLQASLPDVVDEQEGASHLGSDSDTDSDTEDDTSSFGGGKSLISFDDLWRFVVDCWECNGFAEDELQQHTKVFERFCGPEGEMGIVPVHRLLAYMGHENSLEKTRALAQMVDYNGNGTMDVGEFLTLMRLQKEENLKQFLAAYESQDLGNFHIDLMQPTQAALEECNLALPDETVISMMRKVREEDEDGGHGLSFDAFVRLGEMCREIVPSKKRKQAMFKLKEVERLLEVFDSHSSSGEDFLTQSEFFQMTVDYPDLASSSAVQRNRLMAKVKLGWQAAKEAGVEPEELGDPKCQTIHFVPFLYVVRHLLEAHDAKVTEKLGLALVETGFSTAEVSEFRELFNHLANGGEGDAPPKEEKKEEPARGKGRKGIVQPSSPALAGAGAEVRQEIRRRSQVLAQQKAQQALEEGEPPEDNPGGKKSLSKLITKFTDVPCVPVDAVSTFVRSQTKLSSERSKELGKYIVSVQSEQVPGGKRDKEAAKMEGVDFPGFLRVMGWMTKNVLPNS